VLTDQRNGSAFQFCFIALGKLFRVVRGDFKIAQPTILMVPIQELVTPTK
jgi:hypothetical protein